MAEEIEGLHLDITVGTSGAEKKLEDIRREVDEVGKAAESSGKSVDDFAKAAQNILQAMNRLTEATDKNTAAQEQANRVMAEASKNIERTGEAADDAAESTKELGEETEKTAGKMGGSLKTLTKYAAGFFTLQAAQAFARKVFDVRSEIQSLHTSFETLLGDKGQADQLFSSIREFATSTPMQLNDLASAAQTMIGFNIPLEQVMGNLKAIGDVSGGDAQKFQSLTLAFSQMSATGKLMGQDLLQMINAGFNPLAVMVEKTGKSMSKLKEEMSAGSITADMVRQAFIDATSEGGKFHNALEEQSKTLRGAYSNLQGAVDDALNAIGEKTEGVMAGAINIATLAARNFETVGTVVAGLIATFGAYKAAVLAVNAVEAAGNVVLAVKAVRLKIATAWQKALNDAMLKNPYVLAAVALGMVVTSLAAYIVHSKKSKESTDELNKSFADTQAEISAEQRKIDDLFDKLRKAKKGTDEYKTAKDNILSQYGSYLSGLSAEVSSLRDVEGAYKAVTKAAREAAMARGMEAAMKQADEEYVSAYSNSYDKLAAALEKKIGREKAAGLMKTVRGELTKTGTISKQLEDTIRENLRGSASYGNSGAWITGLRNNETTYREARRKAEEKFDIEEPQSPKAAVRNKSVIEAENKQLQAELDALPDQEAMGKRGQALKKKIAANNKTLEKAYSANYGEREAKKNATAAQREARAAHTAAVRQTTFEEKDKELEQKQQLERARAVRELELSVREAQIAAMEEGTDKTVAQIELDHDREAEALRRWTEDLRQKRIDDAKALWEADPSKKSTNFYDSQAYKDAAEVTYTEEELNYLAAKEEEIEQTRTKALKAIYEEQTAAMTAYLKEYGTMQQKRLAIAQEYDEKIRKAQTDGARLQAIAEKEMALKAFDKANADKLIDWEGIFGNLTLYTTQELEHFKNVLREKLSENTTDVEGYKTIVEQINSINEAIVGNEEKQNTFLGMYIRRGTERLKLEREVAEAKEQQAQAEKDAAEKQAAYESAQSGAQTLFGMYGYNGDASNQEGVLSYFRDKFGADTKEYDIASQALNKLQESALDAENAQEKQTEATRRVTTAERQLDNFLGDFAKVLNDAMPTIQQVVDNISSLPDLLGNLGVDADSKVGQAASGLADTANSAMGAMQDYMSGNYIGAASKALDALGSFGDTLGAIGIGGFGSSDADLHKDIERLTQSNQNLQKAIDAMSSELQDADIFESVDIYKRQMEYLRQNTKNTQEMMRRAGAAYSNGFLGIKGQGSSNKKINQGMTSAEWQQISKIAGHSVTSATQFWNLTQEEMYKVMTYANGAWTHLQDLANDGMEDASQWMEEYANGYKQAEELQQQLNEKLTSVSFDSVFDSFKSMVSDMDSTAFDFSKNFEQYMYNAMLNTRLDATFKKDMEAWHQMFSDYMADDGSIDSREMEILRTDYMKMVDEAKKIRDNVAEITGYSTSSQQSTTYTASQSFTQEQGDVLNGRLTAIQIGVQQQGALAQQIQASLAAMNAIVAGNGGVMTEMRNILLIQNNYLDDIARQTKSIYEEFGQKIDRLVTNTNNL